MKSKTLRLKHREFLYPILRILSILSLVLCCLICHHLLFPVFSILFPQKESPFGNQDSLHSDSISSWVSHFTHLLSTSSPGFLYHTEVEYLIIKRVQFPDNSSQESHNTIRMYDQQKETESQDFSLLFPPLKWQGKEKEKNSLLRDSTDNIMQSLETVLLNEKPSIITVSVSFAVMYWQTVLSCLEILTLLPLSLTLYSSQNVCVSRTERKIYASLIVPKVREGVKMN